MCLKEEEDLVDLLYNKICYVCFPVRLLGKYIWGIVVRMCIFWRMNAQKNKFMIFLRVVSHPMRLSGTGDNNSTSRKKNQLTLTSKEKSLF